MAIPDLTGFRVLIVEDEYMLADDLARTFATHGATVVGPIEYLSDALGQVLHDGFDMAVLDLNLHGEATFGLADRLRDENIPFVFVTGYSAEAIPSRFSDVIRFEKPFDLEKITSEVCKACERSRTR